MEIKQDGSHRYLELYKVFKDTVALRIFTEYGEGDRLREFLVFISPTGLEVAYIGGYIDEDLIP